MSDRFAGQVVLIAGGTGGLGRAVTASFLEEGAIAIVTYRRQDEFDMLRQAVGAKVSRLEGYAVDVTDEAAVQQFVEAILSKYGRLHTLINAVGGYATGRALWEMAALAMIDSLAADLKDTGVRANSILPSIIDTEANRKAIPDADYRRWPKPEEIARVILFLCSDDAKVINGASIPL